MLATQFVLLNVVVAVLMKHLEEAKEEDDLSSSASRNSITSSRKDSKEHEEVVVTLKVPLTETFRKVSFDNDSVKKEIQTTVDVCVPPNGGQGVVLPLVAVNGEDVNHSDSEYSTTSPRPQPKVMDHQKPVLSQSAPTLRPVLRTRHRSSSAAPRIVKELNSSSSLGKLSPILGRLAKSRRFDDSDELVSHAHNIPPLEFSGMTNHASENDISPENEMPLSPRAPIYKMSEDSDLYDSNLEGDHYDSSNTSSSPRPSRPSVKSNTSGSSTSGSSISASSTSGSPSFSHDEAQTHPEGKDNAWGTPNTGGNPNVPSSSSGRRRSTSKGRRPSTGESKKRKSNKKQSYV